ncbi:hypothetical protein OG21DRAFT_1514747 [Imleria badia]|nr:hypothetical protein OG21DRAFT_1514747 [Imleria badia]
MAFRSFAILSALLSAAWAQSSNPYIPTGISVSCSTYLTSLNNNTGFTACTSPFTTALQQFAPGSGTTSPSATTITATLNTLCASNAFSGCPQSDFTSQLGSFYAACSVELTSSPNLEVKLTYDVLYALYPLKQAVCAKDDNNNYCVTQLSNSSSTGTVALVDPEKSHQQSLLSQYLYSNPGSALARRDANTTTALVPNATTYQDTNLIFLFLKPFTNSANCNTCTREIITPYITFESNCPYAPGLNSSLLFAGQSSLYNSIISNCPQGFLSGAVQAAGGISSSLVGGAAHLAAGPELSAALGAVLGVAAFIAASL